MNERKLIDQASPSQKKLMQLETGMHLPSIGSAKKLALPTPQTTTDRKQF
jgi:hypothetical protein